jgi:hypothetical protein
MAKAESARLLSIVQIEAGIAERGSFEPSPFLLLLWQADKEASMGVSEVVLRSMGGEALLVGDRHQGHSKEDSLSVFLSNDTLLDAVVGVAVGGTI